MRQFIWGGFKCVSMENDKIRMVIAIDKGCDILEFTYKPSDIEALYQAPAGLGSPIDHYTSQGVDGHFRDRFPGGWFLMVPNGPEPCQFNGANYGQHGEATQLAWQVTLVEDTYDKIVLEFSVLLRRIPLKIQRRIEIRFGVSAVILEEKITNFSKVEVELYWGHHPCFGEPLLGEGAQIILPNSEIIDVGKPGCYFREITVGLNSFFFVRNKKLNLQLSLKWSHDVFKKLGIWYVWDDGDGYPNYASRRLIALEPAIGFPSLAKLAAQRSAICLGAGRSLSTQLEAEFTQLSTCA